MKKLLFLLVILGGALAVFAILRKRRADSDLEEWGSFGGDVYPKAKDSVAGMADAAKGVVQEATDAAKEAAN
jgi:hypothetical protein